VDVVARERFVKAMPFDTNKLREICRRNDVAMVGVFG